MRAKKVYEFIQQKSLKKSIGSNIGINKKIREENKIKIEQWFKENWYYAKWEYDIENDLLIINQNVMFWPEDKITELPHNKVKINGEFKIPNDIIFKMPEEYLEVEKTLYFENSKILNNKMTKFIKADTLNYRANSNLTILPDLFNVRHLILNDKFKKLNFNPNSKYESIYLIYNYNIKEIPDINKKHFDGFNLSTSTVEKIPDNLIVEFLMPGRFMLKFPKNITITKLLDLTKSDIKNLEDIPEHLTLTDDAIIQLKNKPEFIEWAERNSKYKNLFWYERF